MSVLSLSQDLHEFAIELRKLAYTMPGGLEDPLIRLSERMVRHAQQQIAENSPARSESAGSSPPLSGGGVVHLGAR